MSSEEPDASIDININVNRPRRREEDPDPEEEIDEEEEEQAVQTEVSVERRGTSDYKSYPKTNFPPGKTVGEIKAALWDKYDLKENMIPLVNGKEVGDDHVTKPGDELMFQPAPKDRG